MARGASIVGGREARRIKKLYSGIVTQVVKHRGGRLAGSKNCIVARMVSHRVRGGGGSQDQKIVQWLGWPATINKLGNNGNNRNLSVSPKISFNRHYISVR